MPVNTRHKQVSAMAESWQCVRDCMGGGKVIKAAGAKYLPILSWRKDAQKKYDAYKSRAVFENAVKRTHQGLVGLVFCEPPEIMVPKSFELRLNDITLTGVPFVAFGKEVFGQVLAPGRCGVLADMSGDTATVPGPPEPYLAIYAAENIVNWSVTRTEGRQVLTRVVLCENVEEPDPADPFSTTSVEQYRVIELVDGVVQHQLWRQLADSGGKTAGQWAPFGPPVVPTRRGEPLDFIPWVFCNPNGITPDVEDPPLLDLSDINLSAYVTSADLEHGRHFVGLPTPYLFGVTGDNKELEIGGTIWMSDNPETKCGYMEFTGQGLGALEKAIEEKREQMIAQGARLLEKQKRAAETAEALRLRQAGEQSVTAAIAENVGRALSKALAYCVWWADGAADLADVEAEVRVTLNTDFEETILTPQDALALCQTWQLGGMSRRTYAWNLDNGGLLPPDTTPEQEAELIEMETMQRGMGTMPETAEPGTSAT